MIKRRTLLAGTGGLVLSSFLKGCGAKAAALKITLLEGSVPSEVLTKFRKQAIDGVKFELVGDLTTMFQTLQGWQKNPEKQTFSLRRLLPWAKIDEVTKPNNLVSLGDYWLTGAIAQGLIDPLEIPPDTLEKLPLVWQQFVERSDNGQVATAQAAASTAVDAESTTPETETAPEANSLLWAAPYKIQSLVIVYRQSKFPQATADNPPFKAWRDLLSEPISQKLALPDHPRVVLGLVQKMQGGSFNPSFDPTSNGEVSSSTTQLKQQISETFAQLDQQVKTYDSSNALKSLINEDVDVVVTWSQDAVSTLSRYRDFRVTLPAEGSLLSADVWVRPKGADMSAQAQAWIDFCWQSGPATQLSVSGKGLSPIFLKEEASVPTVLDESVLSVAALRNSEPLLPLPAVQEKAYLALWQQLRAS